MHTTKSRCVLCLFFNLFFMKDNVNKYFSFLTFPNTIAINNSINFNYYETLWKIRFNCWPTMPTLSCSQNWGYVIPVAFMISCETNLWSSFSISPQTTLWCFLTNLPQPRANPPLKPNSKLQLVCISYVAYKGDQNNKKQHINPICLFNTLAIMWGIITILHNV